MKKVGYFAIALILFGCGGGKDPILEISPNEIDQYVEEKLDESQEYDVSQSLRFSRENEAYEVVRYMQNDTVVLYLETETTADDQVVRQTFFKDGVPVYVDEYIASNITELPFTQHKIYLDGANVVESFQRTSDDETGLELMDYEPAAITIDALDFERPNNAMMQIGEFELKFEEFITVDQTYLILENSESMYDVALFVNGSHPLLDQMMEDPESFEGRPLFVTHQFILMNSIERTLFVDGYFKDEELPEGN